MLKIVVATAMAAALAGCVTTGRPWTEVQSEEAERLVASARADIKANNQDALGGDLLAAIRRHTGPERVRTLFAENPGAKQSFIAYLTRTMSPEEIRTPQNASALRQTVRQVSEAAVLTSNEVQQLDRSLLASIAEANLKGLVKFTLYDGDGFESLSTPEHKALMARREIEQLDVSPYRASSLDALLKYASTLAPAQRDDIQNSLRKANLRRGDLGLLEKTFPQLASELQSRLFMKTKFVLRGGDRLLGDDIRGVLQGKLHGIAFADDSPVAIITVEKVRHEESKAPERRETITYAQHEVNLVAAALLMPRNASYIYEISTTGASIDYGYVITVEGGNQPKFEKVVRGTQSSQEVRCANARIQNVFGGVTSAGFVANEDMARRCQSNSSKSLEEMRSAVFSEVAEAIASAPQIRPIASMPD